MTDPNLPPLGPDLAPVQAGLNTLVREVQTLRDRPDDADPALGPMLHVRLLALETAIREGDAAIIAKLDELKVAVIKAADALPNLGGLFGRRDRSWQEGGS